MMERIITAVVLFRHAELLDFAGPINVFTAARRDASRPWWETESPFDVWTVAERREPIEAWGGTVVMPRATLEEVPAPRVLLVPGGWGTRSEVNNQRLIGWIAETARKAELVTSVCTGSFMLAQAGLLKGRSATTHWASIDRMRKTHPDMDVREEVAYVEDGNVLTSAGVLNGVELALYIVERLLGKDAACRTARHLEFEVAAYPRP
jgi:transcriptional regulator GlxA family with amidase domain